MDGPAAGVFVFIIIVAVREKYTSRVVITTVTANCKGPARDGLENIEARCSQSFAGPFTSFF